MQGMNNIKGPEKITLKEMSVLLNDIINFKDYMALVVDESNSCVKHTYLHTPWSRVLLEKLTGLQLVKKFPAFYGTRRFITALTSARHLSLT
jgi:hypothetical protein